MNRMEERLREINTILSLELQSRDKQKLQKERDEILNEFKKRGDII